MLASCGRGGNDIAPIASAADSPAVTAANDASADYPVVLGEPYTVDGKLYTPLDTMNHDQVGYATVDGEGGAAISVAHKTLPLPSYVEITSLATGTTILARVDRRGPMTGSRVVGLSPGASQQLGVQDGGAVRLRRVNPPESDRASLRSGNAAPLRMETPKSLLAILAKKLPETGSVSLASAQRVPAPRPAEAPSSAPQAAASAAVAAATPRELPAVATPRAAPRPAPTAQPARVAAAPAPAPRQASFDKAFNVDRTANTNYPLMPLGTAARVASASVGGTNVARTPATATRAPVTIARAPAPVAQAAPRATPRPAPEAAQARPITASTQGKFVIQAAAFSSKANAERAANSLDGFIEKSGRFFRVRTGPFSNRGQAEAALAKVRAAGYNDARVFTAG
ncbi:SPOR domain-containing protein [Pontixanthobacter aquaemixtae]|uniref:SPOR domain-containing protein n=1 Tax=Pontixanthobacter aquaemixtae TaxID=1958940 RepID=A0A844ZQY7_9SPHN|nr:SPOR domain-containing protein [Pontixanthobacter aquaemixtae]MXO90265.1 hypothetical protein [Pontixanthobacter aquaemixtae]